MIPLISSGEKLEAINYVLRASGDLQVDSMLDLSPEGEDVEKYIDRAMGSIQSQGWDFNKDFTQTLTPTHVVIEPEKTSFSEGDETGIEVDLVIDGDRGNFFPEVPEGKNILPKAADNAYLLYIQITEGEQTARTWFDVAYISDGENPFWSCEMTSQNAGSSAVKKWVVYSKDSETIPDFTDAFVTESVLAGDEAVYFSRRLYERITTVTPPVTVDKYTVPSNTIAAVPSTRALRSMWILRGDSMYNRVENTYVVTDPFDLDITYLLDWESTPLVFREWATYLGAAMYLNDVAQDAQLAGDANGLAQQMRGQARGYHIRNGSFSAKRYSSRS